MNKFPLIIALAFNTFTARAPQSEIFASDGKAIKGYDVVAFFNEAEPVACADSLTYAYKGAD